MFFAPDLAIDLGTVNTSIYVRGRGIVVSEPSVVVTDANNKRNILAVGDGARDQFGRTSHALKVSTPVRGGTIADFSMTEAMMRYFVRKAIGPSHLFNHSRMLVSVPCRLKEVDSKAVKEAARAAGAKKVYLIPKPLVSAIGTGLPVFEPMGSMVVDIGGGTTDVAVVSLGGIVVCTSVEAGGLHMDEAVANHLKRQSVLIDPRTAEEIKIDLGSAVQLSASRRIHVRGRDAVTPSIAKDVEFNSVQCCDALREPCRAILGAIKWVLERTPPELSSDIMRTGIHLTGGGSQLFGLDRYLADELKMPVLLAKQPCDCAITGLGYLVENFHLVESIGRQRPLTTD